LGACLQQPTEDKFSNAALSVGLLAIYGQERHDNIALRTKSGLLLVLKTYCLSYLASTFPYLN
jgi:hypothetical protein